jgi:amino acid efflux transporter
MTVKQDPSGLSTPAATALYVGAVLGPAVLLLPALAAHQAGPASLVAWVGLLILSIPLAATFAALGVRFPSGGGASDYVRAALGRRAAAATGWCYLAGVVTGAPSVSLIGGYYVADLVHGGTAVAVGAGAAMFAAVLGANLAGLRVTAGAGLVIAAVLGLLMVVAITTCLPASRSANWHPFAPHGWWAVGRAASTLMLSFVGWEAVSHLVGELADPRRQLWRAMGSALGAVAVLYLGLAIATVGVLGSAKVSKVPLADLIRHGLAGPAGTVTAALAVLLTMGTMNAYIAGALNLAGALRSDGLLPGAGAPTVDHRRRSLALLGAAGLILLALLAVRIIGVAQLILLVGTCFVAVYVLAVLAGLRLLRGKPRLWAWIALPFILVVFGFSRQYIAGPLVVGLAAAVYARRVDARPATAHVATESGPAVS